MATFHLAKVIAENAIRMNANAMLELLPPLQKQFFLDIHDISPWKKWENCPAEHGLRVPLAEAHDLLCRTLNTKSERDD